MALKRSMKAAVIFILSKKRKRARAQTRASTNSLFFVGRCIDNFEVILMWIYMELSLVQILFVVANTKEQTFWIEERKWFLLNLNGKRVSRSWSRTEKFMKRVDCCDSAYQLLKGKMVNIPLPRTSGVAPRRADHVDIFYGNIEFCTLIANNDDMRKSFLFFLKWCRRARAFTRGALFECLESKFILRKTLFNQVARVETRKPPNSCFYLICRHCSMKLKVKELFLLSLVHKSATGF